MAKRKPKVESMPLYEFSSEHDETCAEMTIKCDGEYYFNFRLELIDGVPVLKCWDEGNNTVYYPLRKTVADTFV